MSKAGYMVVYRCGVCGSEVVCDRFDPLSGPQDHARMCFDAQPERDAILAEEAMQALERMP